MLLTSGSFFNSGSGGGGTAFSAFTANTSSATTTYPVISPGDLIIASQFGRQGTAYSASTVPAGFTIIGDYMYPRGSYFCHFITAYKIADGTEGSTYSGLTDLTSVDTLIVVQTPDNPISSISSPAWSGSSNYYANPASQNILASGASTNAYILAFGFNGGSNVTLTLTTGSDNTFGSGPHVGNDKFFATGTASDCTVSYSGAGTTFEALVSGYLDIS